MFSKLLPVILKEEGGYVNDPADSGGATNRGVTQNTYNLFRDRLNQDRRHVRYLTIDETEKIYEGYWTDSRADRLPSGLALMHFDFAVNAGFRRAALTLQEVLEVEADGVIGPKTLAAAVEKNSADTIRKYASSRKDFYERLAKRRPKDRKFLKGWLLRVDRIEAKALDAHRRAASGS